MSVFEWTKISKVNQSYIMRVLGKLIKLKKKVFLVGVCFGLVWVS